MTPQEIREHSAKTFDQIKAGLAKDNNPQSAQVSALCHIMQALWEIAAQLANRPAQSGSEGGK